MTAYLENDYSIASVQSAIGLSFAACKKLLAKPDVKRAIFEVQTQLDDIDFLNEKWVKTQLLRIFPMAMGDEDVPMVTQAGEEIMAKKFYPDIAMRVLEYVAPKTQKSTVAVTINNINKLSDAQLEQIAGRGVTYEHGE